MWAKLLSSFEEVDLMTKIELPNNFRIVFLMDNLKIFRVYINEKCLAI